jgi:hypothetical protein
MAHGSMWWWILPLAPGVAERLIVGNERAFLGWFFEGDHVVHHEAFSPSVVSPDAKACLAAWEFTAPPSSTSTRPSR